MRIHIIRHAQGTHNASNDYNIFDPEITELGIQQAHHTRDHVIAKLVTQPDIIISSTSKRTIQTAKAIFNHDIPLYATNLLLECNTGVPCNCATSIDIQRKCFPDVDFDTFGITDLKREITWDDCHERAVQVIAFLRAIEQQYQYQNIALVTHANFIRNILVVLTGQYHEIEFVNAECRSFDIDIWNV